MAVGVATLGQLTETRSASGPRMRGVTDLLRNALALYAQAGVTLAPGVEPDDVEDAVLDEPASFRSFPLTTLAGLTCPDGEPLLAGTVISAGLSGAADFTPAIHQLARAAGTTASDIAVMPDPGTRGATGSLRVRFGDWDVADINYNFDDATRAFELDLISAVLPMDATAATFPTPDGRDVTVFLPSNADTAGVNALMDAIETEFAKA